MTADVCMHTENAKTSKRVQELKCRTAHDLMSQEFAPVRYVVQDYVAEGLTVLAGKPKLGKSWLSLNLALAVASGAPALGGSVVEQGTVLYLALEDNERRLQRRLSQLLGGEPPPAALFIATECPRLDKGGIQAIERWLEQHPDAKLVIVDVFTKVRSEGTGRETPYEGDYRALVPLKSLAEAYRIAVVIVHHTRKMDADDPFDTVAGTTGFTGAADTVLVLSKGGDGTTLYARGRDIEERETALSFDVRTGTWTAQGAADDVRRSTERKAILGILDAAEAPMSIRDIASKLECPPNRIKQLLHKMAKAGEVDKPRKGQYVHPAYRDFPPPPDNDDNSVTGRTANNITDIAGYEVTGVTGPGSGDQLL